MTGFFIAIVIVLVITCLVVRDQTEFKLGKMRTDLLSLRTEEKRIEETRTEVDQMVRWVSEALSRAEKRQRTAEGDSRGLEDMLNEMGIELKPDAAVEEAASVEAASVEAASVEVASVEAASVEAASVEESPDS